MLGIAQDMAHGVLELTVDGGVDRADYEAAVAAVDAMLKTRDKIDVIEIVRDIGWIAPEIWWRDLVFHLGHRHFMRRAAVVSDHGWVGPIVRLFAPFYPSAIRTFPESRLDEARAWVREADPS